MAYEQEYLTKDEEETLNRRRTALQKLLEWEDDLLLGSDRRIYEYEDLEIIEKIEAIQKAIRKIYADIKELRKAKHGQNGNDFYREFQNEESSYLRHRKEALKTLKFQEEELFRYFDSTLLYAKKLVKVQEMIKNLEEEIADL